ncbi:hypothetical protein [Rufibacter roseus]|uniref:Uncharacterized protein n=1 Tax=Rufibacter roseus TaxID=1567108 RepID=A0ABW2DNC6_9BACT|nr:hypothetical protein [Rufibacter roseus]
MHNPRQLGSGKKDDVRTGRDLSNCGGRSIIACYRTSSLDPLASAQDDR